MLYAGLVGSAFDHRTIPPSSNLGVVISEGCFIFHFASLQLEVARPIQLPICTTVAVKHQLSSPMLYDYIKIYMYGVSNHIEIIVIFLYFAI